MKLSLKFREEPHHQNPLLRAKIPVTVLSFPFLTAITAGDSADLSFSLRSNFLSGPSLSLSYHPTLDQKLPFSLSLKSGIGLFGSPHGSPLTFTAQFNPNSLTPTFSLSIKPQFGNFELFKKVDDSGIKVDGQSPNGELENGSESDFGVSAESGGGSVEVLKKDSSILNGILVAARTTMPVARRAVVNFRWGVSFPTGSWVAEANKPVFPMLVMNKVSLERVDEAKEEGKEVKEAKTGDLELLKGMCSWMSREVEELQRENKEMKQVLEGMRGKGSNLRGRGEDKERDVVGKRGMGLMSNESLPELEKWRSKKGSGNGGGGDENGHRDSKKATSRLSEVESELQKAIKAASA